MDSAHVALTTVMLKKEGFAVYHCERSVILGLNLTSLSKILKTTDNSDAITFRHDDDADVITIVADAVDGSKTSEFQMKLMEIEAESMGVPEMEYKAKLSMPSSDFAKVVRDMGIFGETVTINVVRDGIKFSAAGDIGDGFAFFKATGKFEDKKPAKSLIKDDKEEKPLKVKAEKKEAAGSSHHLKEEKEKDGIKKESTADDDDTPLAEKYAPTTTTTTTTVKTEKKEKTSSSAAASSEGPGVYVSVEEDVSLAFALRYLNTFAKGASLADRVELYLAKDSPCMIEYRIEGLGYLRYYLAPKVDEN